MLDGELNDKSHKLCTACEEYESPTSRCGDSFVCCVCGYTLRKCASLPGGLESEDFECNSCYWSRFLAEEAALKLVAIRLKFYEVE